MSLLLYQVSAPWIPSPLLLLASSTPAKVRQSWSRLIQASPKLHRLLQVPQFHRISLLPQVFLKLLRPPLLRRLLLCLAGQTVKLLSSPQNAVPEIIISYR